jgi:hypothetical protein
VGKEKWQGRPSARLPPDGSVKVEEDRPPAAVDLLNAHAPRQKSLVARLSSDWRRAALDKRQGSVGQLA